jgi:hypothetical protein
MEAHFASTLLSCNINSLYHFLLILCLHETNKVQT